MSRLAALIPPKLASPSAIGAPSSAARMAKVVEFYSALPKGPAPKKRVGASPLARYKARYFDGPNASAAPFLHVIGGLFLLGYTIDYNMHLKHHKNNHHVRCFTSDLCETDTS
ncbi:mitochondrial F1-F0 ATP synthase subunit F of fungi-domain-containing protein [Rhodotorula toruloides]